MYSRAVGIVAHVGFEFGNGVRFVIIKKIVGTKTRQRAFADHSETRHPTINALHCRNIFAFCGGFQEVIKDRKSVV